MNRRGMETFAVVVSAVIALLILALAYFILLPSFGSVKTAFTCGEGGDQVTSCQSSCGDGSHRAYFMFFGCQSGQVCCAADDTSSIVNTAAGSTGTTVALQAPEITIRRGTTILNEGQTEPLFPADPGAVNAEYVVTFKTYSDVNNNNPVACAPKEIEPGVVDISKRTLCTGQWNKTIMLESKNNGIVQSASTIQGLTTGMPVSGNNDLLSITMTAAPKTVKSGNIYITTSSYAVKTRFGQEYNGQTLRLIATAIPGKEAGEMPDLERQATLYFKVFNGITVNGLTPSWQQQKTVTVQCDPKLLTCSDVYLYFIAKEVATCPSLDTIKGMTSNSMLLPERPTEYCLTNDARVCGQEYATEGECQEAKSQMESATSYVSAASAAYASLMNRDFAQTGTSQAIELFGNSIDEAARMNCVAKKQTITNVDVSNRDRLYDTDFNPLTQKTTAILDQGWMTDSQLCVYATSNVKKDGQEVQRIYSAGKPQRVFIDTIPPEVKVTFNPLTLRLHFICIDGMSGCKDTVGITFISEVYNFLPALFRSPQSAATWCPATAGSYDQRTVKDATYSMNEVRVLCMRGEDNAGNAALTMKTVYPTYDILALAIVEAQKRQDT